MPLIIQLLGPSAVALPQGDRQAPTLDNIVPAPDSLTAIDTTNITFRVLDAGSGIAVGLLNVYVTREGQAEELAMTGNGIFSPGWDGPGSIIAPSGTGYAVTIDPAATLDEGELISVRITATDQAVPTSNAVEFTYSFTIADTTAPVANSFAPANGVTGAEYADDNIVFRVTDTGSGIDTATLTASVQEDTGPVTAMITAGAFQPGFTGPASAITPITDGFLVVIDPTTDFPTDTDISITGSVADASGNTTPFSWAYTTGDPAPPPPPPTGPQRNEIPPGVRAIAGHLGVPTAVELAGVTFTGDQASIPQQIVPADPLDDDYATFTSGLDVLTIEFGDQARHLAEEKFSEAQFVGIRIRVRAVATTPSTMQVEPLVPGAILNARLARTLQIGIVAQEHSILFMSEENTPGQEQHITLATVQGLRTRLTAVTAGEVRLSHITVEALFLPVTSADFPWSNDPAQFGWVSIGGLSSSASSGIRSVDDNQVAGHAEWSHGHAMLDSHGAVATAYETSGPWTVIDGVFCFKAVSVTYPAIHLELNLLYEGATPRIGLLRGHPSNFDPTLIASYFPADFTWEDGLPHTFELVWDETDVLVYADFSDTPILQVARTLIGAGVTEPNQVRFGSGTDGITQASQGVMRLHWMHLRGERNPTSDAQLDIKTRYNLARNSITQTDVASTILVWRPSVDITNYRFRYGGISQDTGFFISTLNGSRNTEGAAVAAGAEVVSELNVADLLTNDNDPPGERFVWLYVRQAATGLWSTQGNGALRIPLAVWQDPQPVLAEDFIQGEDTTIRLTSSGQFLTYQTSGSHPPSAQQSATLTREAGTEVLESYLPPPIHIIDGVLPEASSSYLPRTFAPFTVAETATIEAIVEDAFGQQALQIFQLNARIPGAFDGVRCDAGTRFAVPLFVQDKDPILMEKYLPIWDGLLCQFWRIADGVKEVLDPETMPFEMLRYAFMEMGLTYPEVPDFPEAALRRVLLNANQIQRSRFTLQGLRFYLGLLIPNASVTIDGATQLNFIFCNSSALGLPDVAMLESVGTVNDVNNYLIGPGTPSQLLITIVGTTSAPMQEFIRSVIRQHIPYADDPINPMDITVVFV